MFCIYELQTLNKERPSALVWHLQRMISIVRAFFTTQCVTARNFGIRSLSLKTGWRSTQSCLWIGVAVFVIVVGGWTLEKEPEQKSVMAQRGDSGASITIAKEQTLSRESWQAGAAPVFVESLPKASLARFPTRFQQRCGEMEKEAGRAPEAQCPQQPRTEVFAGTSLQSECLHARSAFLLAILARVALSSSSGSR